MPICAYSAFLNSFMSIACIDLTSLSSNTWLYVSSVFFVLLCPNLSATTFAVTLLLMSNEACVCRRQ